MSDVTHRHFETIWFPFTKGTIPQLPIFIKKAKGSRLYDVSGKEYIDAISSWWVNIFGHAYPPIVEAIQRQAMDLPHVAMADFFHEKAIEVANGILNLKPGFKKVFFSDDGSTSVEVALKLSIQYWQACGINKIKIFSLENAYHGDTFGAMAASSPSVFNENFKSLTFQNIVLPLPNQNNLPEIYSKIESHLSADTAMVFIFEPLVQGAGGMQMYEALYLDKLLNFFKQFHSILIADEVMTGFYRTGKLFATDYLQTQVDMLCLSKGLTGGFLPLGLTLINHKISEKFTTNTGETLPVFYHGHSYTGNALACSAAAVTIKHIQNDSVKNAVKNIANFWQNTAIPLLKNLKIVANLRQTGTIIAFEWLVNQNNYLHPVSFELKKFFMQNGIYCRPLGNTLYFMPPYCITNDELQKILEVTLKKVEATA